MVKFSLAAISSVSRGVCTVRLTGEGSYLLFKLPRQEIPYKTNRYVL